MARLLAAIHGMIDALIPVIGSIKATPTRPWSARARLSGRFYAVIRDLLALTARVRPDIFAHTPPLATRPLATPRLARPGPGPECRQQRLSDRVNTSRPDAPITARQLARRLATLLHRLLCLAAEARAALPARLYRQAARARAIAGCDAPPTPLPSWERAG